MCLGLLQQALRYLQTRSLYFCVLPDGLGKCVRLSQDFSVEAWGSSSQQTYCQGTDFQSPLRVGTPHLCQLFLELPHSLEMLYSLEDWFPPISLPFPSDPVYSLWLDQLC